MEIHTIAIQFACGHTEILEFEGDKEEVMAEAKMLATCPCSECSKREYLSQYN